MASRPFAMGIKDNLDQFAAEHGADTWKSLPESQLPGDAWKSGVTRMLADPNQSVLFNSGGVDVWPGVTRAASGVEFERLLEATLWGEPLLGQTAVRLADGTKVSWRGGRWSVWPEREVAFAERG